MTTKTAPKTATVTSTKTATKPEPVNVQAEQEASVLKGRVVPAGTNGKARRTASPKAKAEPKPKAEKRELTKAEKLMRPATKNVQDYVVWLRSELGPEWSKLSGDPKRLAEISIQNYGSYQAVKRAAR